jgi:hypothetical protein
LGSGKVYQEKLSAVKSPIDPTKSLTPHKQIRNNIPPQVTTVTFPADMSTGYLSNDDVFICWEARIRESLTAQQFFLRLAELFDERRRKDHGSIHLTQKSKPISRVASMAAWS